MVPRAPRAGSNRVCPVCMDELQFEIGAIIPCGHCIHQSCFESLQEQAALEVSRRPNSPASSPRALSRSSRSSPSSLSRIKPARQLSPPSASGPVVVRCPRCQVPVQDLLPLHLQLKEGGEVNSDRRDSIIRHLLECQRYACDLLNGLAKAVKAHENELFHSLKKAKAKAETNGTKKKTTTTTTTTTKGETKAVATAATSLYEMFGFLGDKTSSTSSSDQIEEEYKVVLREIILPATKRIEQAVDAVIVGKQEQLMCFVEDPKQKPSRLYQFFFSSNLQRIARESRQDQTSWKISFDETTLTQKPLLSWTMSDPRALNYEPLYGKNLNTFNRKFFHLTLDCAVNDPQLILYPAVGKRVMYSPDLYTPYPCDAVSDSVRSHDSIKEGEKVYILLCGVYADRKEAEKGLNPIVKPAVVQLSNESFIEMMMNGFTTAPTQEEESVVG